VVDEAHHLEEEATRQFGFEVGRRHLADAADSLADSRGRGFAARATELSFDPKVGDAARRSVAEAADEASLAASAARPLGERLLVAAGAFARSPQAESEGRRRLTDGAREDPAWVRVLDAWDSLRTALDVMRAAITRLRGALAPLAPLGIEKFDDLMLEANAQEREASRLLEQIHAIVAEPPPGYVCWVEADGEEHGSLHAAPIDVSDLLGRRLFGEKSSVVLTSATLATAGDFSFTRSRLGLDRHTRQVALGSPFDYERHARVFAPSDDVIPEPNRHGHDAAIGQALTDIALASEGRMLALFTSHASLRRARGAMRPALERKGIAVLGQNVDGPRGQLLAAFRANPRSVLLGAASFWEGVDIPGDALSVLVIARLPFGVPTDPVFAARSEQFDDAFGEFAVPQAVLRFRQGFGRLIRSASDRGVVVVLDTRIRTKRYGASFRDSLPREMAFLPARQIAPAVRAFLDER
jgi:DNA polymerase-3 subunit epsilon/ATP-dependent DNA helicase DinG